MNDIENYIRENRLDGFRHNIILPHWYKFQDYTVNDKLVRRYLGQLTSWLKMGDRFILNLVVLNGKGRKVPIMSIRSHQFTREFGRPNGFNFSRTQKLRFSQNDRNWFIVLTSMLFWSNPSTTEIKLLNADWWSNKAEVSLWAVTKIQKSDDRRRTATILNTGMMQRHRVNSLLCIDLASRIFLCAFAYLQIKPH